MIRPMSNQAPHALLVNWKRVESLRGTGPAVQASMPLVNDWLHARCSPRVAWAFCYADLFNKPLSPPFTPLSGTNCYAQPCLGSGPASKIGLECLSYYGMGWDGVAGAGAHHRKNEATTRLDPASCRLARGLGRLHLYWGLSAESSQCSLFGPTLFGLNRPNS